MASAAKRKKARDCRVTLPADLVIGAASEVHAQLCDALAQPAPVVLDAAAVARLDTAGLQLLQAFVQACDERSTVWRWEHAGDELRQSAALLGLDPMLQLPDTAPAND